MQQKKNRGKLAVHALCALTAVLGLSAAADAAENCGHPHDRPRHFGPFDYRSRARLTEELDIVERHHFTTYMNEVAQFGFSSREAVTVEEKKEGRDLIAGNLDYTLRSFPNHFDALHAMATWQLRLRDESVANYERLKNEWSFLSADCYFERALMYAPDDGMVYLAYGVYLHKLDQLDAALERYERAAALMPDSPEVRYNLGLLHYDRAEYAQAAERAADAYALGYPLQGLERRLARRGVAVERRPLAAD